MRISHLTITLIAALILTSCTNFHFRKKVITIGSGSQNTTYYPIATSLCKIFNKYNQDQNITCKAKLSRGAEYNLNAVENNKFDMGIAGQNLQHAAYYGYQKFTNNPHKNLRTLFGLHYSYLTIIAKKDAHIKSFSDLKGKKITIGLPGSGSRILFLQMINEIGWNLDDFDKVYEVTGSNINKTLCGEGKADAAIYLIGHPNKSFESVIENCNTELVSLSDNEIKRFMVISPLEFKKLSISKNAYSSNTKKINSFAVRAILSASKELDSKIVENFVKIISENKKELLKEQPALTSITFFDKDYPNIAPIYDGLNK